MTWSGITLIFSPPERIVALAVLCSSESNIARRSPPASSTAFVRFGESSPRSGSAIARGTSEAIPSTMLLTTGVTCTGSRRRSSALSSRPRRPTAPPRIGIDA